MTEVKTIGEVERIVHASGQWDGTGPVEFSTDGTTWAESWGPTAEHPFPEFARVEVHRKDVRVSTRTTIRWDEQIPRADEFWAAKWTGAPMRHFGRTARMVAYRQTFRDLLGDIAIEDEDSAPAPTPDADRDWAAEFAAAEDIAAIDKLDAEARAARIFTPDDAGTALHRAFKQARAAVLAATPASADEAWAPVDHIPDQPRLRHRHAAPRDYLPPAGNRAARRAAQRKGGRR